MTMFDLELFSADLFEYYSKFKIDFMVQICLDNAYNTKDISIFVVAEIYASL